jgi:hypothetical protein
MEARGAGRGATNHWPVYCIIIHTFTVQISNIFRPPVRQLSVPITGGLGIWEEAAASDSIVSPSSSFESTNLNQMNQNHIFQIYGTVHLFSPQ